MTTEPSPSLPWKTQIALTLISALTDACSRPNGKINSRFFSYLEFKASPNPKPVNGVKSFDITVDPSQNFWFRLLKWVFVGGKGSVGKTTCSSIYRSFSLGFDPLFSSSPLTQRTISAMRFNNDLPKLPVWLMDSLIYMP